ncbi:hypothetical protein Slin15195_G068810 [Septoria linicola]|uniref:Uncharacterized protein n=1 Tax=Septoria linicola TaxID=215465 RepID=A0A9Q9AX53_9PEZI|nr:hypothetical protein Slin15195_G068810 [Septoria linicola]
MHFLTALLATVAVTLGTASAQQVFTVNPFHATDKTSGVRDDLSNPYKESHCIDFNVSRPAAVPQQGGDGQFHCRVEWDGCHPKTCYTPCTSTGVGIGNSEYWARVNPTAGWKGKTADDISVDLLQYYSYRNSVVQNGTFFLKNQETGSYACEKSYDQGTETEYCTLRANESFDVDVGLVGYGIYPVSDVVEIC